MLVRLSQFLWVLFGGLWALLAPPSVGDATSEAGDEDGAVGQEARRSPAIVAGLLGLPFWLLQGPVPVQAVNRYLDRRFWPETAPIRLVGLLLQAAGLGLALWARLTLRRGRGREATASLDPHLVRSGPYQLVTHPIYTGILAGLLGSALVAGQVRGLIAFALLLAAYPRKHDLEDAALRGRLGGL